MANASALASYNAFYLKRSRMMIVFQAVFFVLIMLGLFQVLHPILGIILLLVGCLLWWMHFRQPYVEHLEQLDHAEWSFKMSNSTQIQRGQIAKMLDHHFYIIVYFSDQRLKPLVIWQDQMPLNVWKMLKTRVNLT